MAKKNYVKVTDTWETKVDSDSADKSILLIKGKNSKGTSVEVSIVMDDYFFPHIISDMAKIGRQRVETATSRLKNIKNAIEE